MYVIIENHFIKDHCLNAFMKLAEEIVEYSRGAKGCLSYNVFERKSVKNQAIIIAYWEKAQQYIQYLRTQKAVFLKNRLRSTLKMAPHVDLYYSIAGTGGNKASQFRRAHLKNTLKHHIYRPGYYSAAVREHVMNEVEKNEEEKHTQFMHLNQRYVNVSTSTELLMRMREEERERKRRQMLEDQRKYYHINMIKDEDSALKKEIQEQ